ncbi:uncharacterized protein [Physcomitrium patens]|uniref:uncharacterized protein n=1 Tax=Physcomitrium patens TaxID=3218 RepID=UPI003CCE4073
MGMDDNGGVNRTITPTTTATVEQFGEGEGGARSLGCLPAACEVPFPWWQVNRASLACPLRVAALCIHDHQPQIFLFLLIDFRDSFSHQVDSVTRRIVSLHNSQFLLSLVFLERWKASIVIEALSLGGVDRSAKLGPG